MRIVDTHDLGRRLSLIKMAQVAQKVANFGIRVGTNVTTKAITFGKPRLQTFWRYAKVELGPPGLSEMPQISESINKIVASARTGAWRKLTVKDAVINGLVCVEVGCWFFVGEILGKGNIVGYYIPGAVHYDAEF